MASLLVPTRLMRRLSAVILVLLVACSSPEREAREAHETADSWRATGALLATEWARGAVTDAYAADTARKAVEEVRALRPVDAEAVRMLEELERLIRAGDRSAAQELAARLR